MPLNPDSTIRQKIGVIWCWLRRWLPKADARKRVLGVACFFMVWILVAQLPWARSGSQVMWFPTPVKTGKALYDILCLPASRDCLLTTFTRILEAVLLAGLVGTFAGLLLGYLHRVYAYFSGILDFLRSIPPAVLFPAAFFVVPEGDAPRLFVAFFGCLPIMVGSVAESVINIPRERREYCRKLTAGCWFRVRHLYFYELRPGIFHGLRLSVSLSVIIVIVSEMLRGDNKGIGDRLTAIQYTELTVPYTAAYCTIIGLFGMVVNGTLRAFDRRFTHWKN